MSLALDLDVAASDGATRLTALVGLLMTASLALAAVEQFTQGGRGWLGAAVAVACAAWCIGRCRRSVVRRQVGRQLRLQIKPDGSIGLAASEGEGAVAAAVVSVWQLGGLVCLRLRPTTVVFGSGDCLFLLVRGSFDHASWHGLRRWLVWYRRSRRLEPAVV
jgi:hypothetical protein